MIEQNYIFCSLSLSLSLSFSLSYSTHTYRTVENGKKTVIRLENGKLVSKTIDGMDALEGDGASPAGAIESEKHTRGKKKHF